MTQGLEANEKETIAGASLMLVEALKRIAAVLEEIKGLEERIADHLVPPPNAVVGTSYVAHKLGCSTTGSRR